MYAYHAKNLLIAYISAISISAVLVGAGFYCIKDASSESFASSFSTIVRTTRNSELDEIVPAAATSGAQPLPKRLATTEIMLVRRTCGQKGGHDNEELRTCFDVIRDDIKCQELGISGTSSDEAHQQRNSTEASLLEKGPEHPKKWHLEGDVSRRGTV